MRRRNLLIFKAFRALVRYTHESTMIRHRYMVGAENLPPEDSRRIFVCNHQNTASDPVNINIAFPDRYNFTSMARADVFNIHPIINRLLEALGIVPAFRAGWEGIGSTERNFESFDVVAERVNECRPFLIFPEGGHTQGHYLDPFTTGAARLAFYIAEKNGWKDDLHIVPLAHHYSDFFDVRADFLLMIGKPISILSYKEEYEQHPYRVLRKVRNRMRESVGSMMLDMGCEDYLTKDFLRRSALNPATLRTMELPERLKADKQFVKALLENERYAEVMALAKELHCEERRLGLKDVTVAQRPSLHAAAVRALCLLVMLPLWLVSLWPHAVFYTLPLRLLRTDKMFTNSYRYIFSLFVLLPAAMVVTVAVMWLLGLPWLGVLWIVLWMPTARFTHAYYKQCLLLVQALRLARHKGELPRIEALRNRIAEMLG